MTPQLAGMGVAWYTSKAWKQLEALPEAQIEKSYQDFVRAFNRIMQDLAAQGMRAEKVVIDDIAPMVEWCHRNGYEVDHKGRAAYGALLTMARDDPDALNAPVIDTTRVVN